MASHALLIGSPAGGLEGPLPDVGRMAALLEPRGFEVRRVVDQDATRDGILHAYRSLIDDAASGDAVAIYYSGHGAHSLDEEYKPESEHDPEKRYHHFIVPMDLGDSSEDDFRGILSLELSSLLAQLTNKTKNVTVVFDCCHSGGMTRDLRLRLKALSKQWHVGAHGHLERLKRGEVSGFSDGQLPTRDNEDAVRLMAALPSQQAWEYEGPQGAYGIMTGALVQAFEEAAGRPVTWNAIKRRVREVVRKSEPGQYPDVEGPSSRFVFQLEEADLTDVVGVESSDDGPRLEGGRLLGIEKGDEYVVMPPGFQKIEREQALATAKVTHVAGSFSLVSLDPSEAAANLPNGAQAFPTSRTHHQRAVVVNVGGELQSALEAAITESGLLRLPAEGETEDAPDVLAVVEELEGQVHIREKSELDLILPLAATTPKLAETVAENLGRLARARKLETMDSGSGGNELTAQYELDWGRVVGGEPQPLARSGAMLFVGDRIYVRVVNKSESKLYVSVFDIGLAGKVTLLTKNRGPSGVELEPDGAPYILGYAEHTGWKGLGPLTWPDEVPDDGQPRPEALVVIISDNPQDLRALEAPGMAAPKGAEAGRSELERLADQVSTGRTRDLGADDAPPEVRYAVEHISTLVDPNASAIHVPAVAGPEGAATRGASSTPASAIPSAAVQDVGGFLINDRPDESAAYRRPRGPAPPSAVAIQLGELVIHSNRALFSTSVRVDALVITGAESVEGTYNAGTAKFDGIKDGDRLPLDNLLVYHGPAKGFVDVAVWVSKDDKESLELMQLLKEQVNETEFKDAALVLAGLAVAAPAAGAIVAGMGAATTVANVAYKVLSKAVGKSIGLYRTSLLANERFGVGLHPASGLMRAQDFSFSYKVTEV